MSKAVNASYKYQLRYGRILSGLVLACTFGAMSTTAFAQQVGGVVGYVTDAEGNFVEGVAVIARSSVLPSERETVSGKNGRYQLPALPPGHYTLTFRSPNGAVIERTTNVLLQQKIKLDVEVGTDEVIVVGQRMLVDLGAASLKNTIDAQTINNVPVGQEYRDLIKLIPGVQYSEDTVRGPSAGGSGQDNIYQFDGVDVSLPMFGNLSAEPSTHDIAQVSIVRGGAKAVGFNRSGGFKINTVSKSGSNEFHGQAGYRMQTAGLTADQDTGDGAVKSETDRDWITVGLGGPILKDKLFFYGSYYRPTVTSQNQSNVYGDVGDFKSTRDQFFGKLTAAPTDDILLNLSYVTSERSSKNSGVGGFDAATLSQGNDASFDNIIAEGSWVIDNKSSLSFKFTDFTNKTSSRPDTILDLSVSLGDPLDVNNLDQLGRFSVPTLDDGDAAQNAFVQPIIDQYGYVDENGVRQGGGRVGQHYLINNQDFFRTNYELAYDRTIETGDLTHDVHIGYQYQEIEENLARFSNGLGRISAPAGTITATDGLTPVYFQAQVYQTGIVGANGDTIVPKSIDTRATLQSFEINDTIEYDKWTVDLGVMVSKDVLYGQGLREVSGNLSGFELAPGHEYKMHTTDWADLIQPRLGVRYELSDRDSVYANFAKYNPPASSLARAASWDRNFSRELYLNYDANGNFIDSRPIRSSSGKFFQDDLKPRYVKEFLIGWDRQVNDELTVRASGRHRKGGNFWEDTPNTARLSPLAPQEIQDLGLYIPNLADVRAEIGGSSYVIAQLDTAYTKYWEANFEAEYQAENWYLKGSYVWSSYKGNFDQDNSTSSNDGNIFIGSSNIADGIGRQVWNNKDGILRGDRPHQFKLYGFYDFTWKGRAGFYSAWQSGQPWEEWSYEAYRPYYGGFSSTNRYAEEAGSRRSPSHFQFDVNYTQDIEVMDGKVIELRADVFNLFNSQTGYNYNPFFNSAGFGEPRSYYNPRRIQLSAKVSF